MINGKDKSEKIKTINFDVLVESIEFIENDVVLDASCSEVLGEKKTNKLEWTSKIRKSMDFVSSNRRRVYFKFNLKIGNGVLNVDLEGNFILVSLDCLVIDDVSVNLRPMFDKLINSYILGPCYETAKKLVFDSTKINLLPVGHIIIRAKEAGLII